MTAAVPDAFRDQLERALCDAGVHAWRLDALMGALMPVIAAEIARVQAAAEQRAAEELRTAADILDGQARACDDEHDDRGFAAYGWAAEVVRSRAAALSQPAPGGGGQQ